MADDALIRRENLNRLCKERGWNAADLHREAAYGTYPYFRDLLTDGNKSFGEKTARRLEDALGLSRNALDEVGHRGVSKLLLQEPATSYGAKSAGADSEPAGRPRHIRPTPVIGTARLGPDGFYECQPGDDGFVDSYSADPEVYALRVKGDSMHPAIRHGQFVVVEPNGRCVPEDYVAVALRNGRRMVKELVHDRPTEVVLLSVNGGQRMTIDRADIETMHPVAAIIPASKWRPEP